VDLPHPPGARGRRSSACQNHSIGARLQKKAHAANAHGKHLSLFLQLVMFIPYFAVLVLKKQSLYNLFSHTSKMTIFKCSFSLFFL
jgi:hypothetical protein